MKLLLVEDNRKLSDWLARLLVGQNYTVDCVFDAAEAGAALACFDYDLVVLDLGLPDGTGIDILRAMRGQGVRAGVLILTASDSLEARVAGLDAGADDYLAKPFEVAELEARLRALVRRSRGRTEPTLQIGRIAFDTTHRTFSADGALLSLTPRERTVLELLVVHAGSVVAKETLAEALFGFNEDSNPAAVEVYIHRVRRKTADLGLEIATLRGIGYVARPSP